MKFIGSRADRALLTAYRTFQVTVSFLVAFAMVIPCTVVRSAWWGLLGAWRFAGDE